MNTAAEIHDLALKLPQRSRLKLALDENYINAVEFDTIADASCTLAGKLVALSKSLGRKARIQ